MKIDRIREEIEMWARLIGKKRVEERLRIKILDLDLEEHNSPTVVYD